MQEKQLKGAFIVIAQWMHCFVGTSTDVSRYAGTYEHVFETTTAGVSIQAPQVSLFSSSFIATDPHPT